MKTGDYVIIYSGRHYGRLHQVLEIKGYSVMAVHVTTRDLVSAPMCDCEAVSKQEET